MSENEKTFESAITELEELISEVESGSLPLEKMIERIDRGAKLIKLCQSKLNVMNGKVEMLFKDDGANGEFADFNTTNDRVQAAAPESVTAAPAPRSTQNTLPQEELPF